MKILVIGDVILDLYTRCGCERISPEAPVPVLLPRSSSAKLGGAANVALCCAALGAQVHCASVVGCDETASELERLLEQSGIRPLFVRAPGRISSKKERLIASAQQVARIDSESSEAVSDADAAALCALLDEHYDAAIISDYAKGVLSRPLVQAVRARAPLVLADPKNSLELLRGVDVITPNLKEAKRFAAVDAQDFASVLAALRGFAARYDIARPAITLSERGIAMLSASGQLLHSAAAASEVYDVTGAGDSVIAALAVALAAGSSEAAALEFANACASVSVSKLGTYAPRLEEIAGAAEAKSKIAAAVADNPLPNEKRNLCENAAENPKLMSLEQAVEFAKNRRAVWTNGCFDILHAGHCSYLAAARALGDCLIVGLNSDASVRALKGPARPINSAADRAAVLAALAAVDAIVIFDAPTPIECIRALRPAVLAKGADYAPEQVIGREFAGELALIEFLPGRSSSEIIKKCKEEK